MIWAPVCGRDGKVYDNDCFARCAKAKPAFQCGINMAACKKECKCRSACGTNKACVAKCKPAKPRPKPICICGKVYAPVCAKNGRVYNNPCLAKVSRHSFLAARGALLIALALRCRPTGMLTQRVNLLES